MAAKKRSHNINCEPPVEVFEIEKLCGEIYLTIQHNVIFYCTLCSKQFENFQSYLNHIKKRHETISFAFENFPRDNQNKIDEGFDVACIGKLDFQKDDFSFEDYNKISEMKDETSLEDIPDMGNDAVTTSITIEPNIAMKKKCEEHIRQNKLIYFEETPQIIETSEEISSEECQVNDLCNKKTISKEKPSKIKKEILTKPTSEEPSVTKDKEEANTLFLEHSNDTRPVRKRVFCNKIDDAERPHKCPVCGAGFKDNNNMRGHARRHSKVKRFECSQCLKKFYTGSEVNVHMRTHTGERPFLCSLCGRTFQTNCKLTDHIKRHNNQRDFKCALCNKAFFNSDSLRDHMKCHASIRPYECQKCSAKFVRPNSLADHMKLHANKRQYGCVICPAKFNQQAGLFSHMKTTHKNPIAK